MRVLIFGATGAAGLLLIREVLTILPTSSLVLYVRSPEKIPADISSHPLILIIKGQLDDVDAISKAMEGVNVVLSALGPQGWHPSGTPLAHAYSRIIDIMHKHKVKRLIALGTASIKDPNDQFSYQFWVLINGVALLARNAYDDIVAIGAAVKEQGADLDWTIVRVPLLTNNDSREVVAGYVGDGKTKTRLSRAAFATFVIGEIEKKDWIKKAPLISSP